MRRKLVSRSGVAAAFAMSAILLSAAFVASACSDLGDFTLGVCGNSVLDTGEDCEPGDKNSDPTKPGYCAPKGDPAECHYVCAKSACPTGEFCGVDQVCRAPEASFVLAGQPLASIARDIRIADFDGDGHADVLVEKKDGSIDLHFPTDRELGVATPLPADASEGVAVGFVNHDVDATNTGGTAATRERADLLVGSGAALAALLGDTSRKLTVLAVSSYSFSAPAKILAIPSQAVALPTQAPISEALKPDTEVEGLTYDLNTDPNTGKTLFKVLLKNPYGGGTPSLPGLNGNGDFGVSAADLSPINTLRPLVDDSMDRPQRCDEIVLTAPVDNAAFIVYPCGPLGVASTAVGSTPINGVRIGVPSGVSVVGPALVADVIDLSTNLPGADGHLDVLLPTLKAGVFGLYVAPGDGSIVYPNLDSNRNVVALDYCQHMGVAHNQCGRIDADGGILALRDLNGDGVLDIVTPKGVDLSTAVSPTSPDGFYGAAFPSLVPWAEAVVADVNHDGHLDVVAAPDGGRAGLEVLYGTSDSYFNPSVLPTTNPVGLLTVGDYDGDLVDDIVARAAAQNPEASCDIPDEIVAFFGRTSGGLEGGTVVGRIASANQIISGRLPRLDRRDSIFDFGVASHCMGDSYRVSVFYGTSDRLLDAPFLLDDQFGDPTAGNIASYTPDVIALPAGRLGATSAPAITLAALATYNIFHGVPATPTDTSELYIEQSDPTSLFKQQSLVSLQPITDLQAKTGALAVGSFGADTSADVVVWLPGDSGGPSRLVEVHDFGCARTGGPPLANTCMAENDKDLITNVEFPTNPGAGSVLKSQIIVADVDGDGDDDLVLVVVSSDGQGGLFFAENTTVYPTAPDPNMPPPPFLIHQIAGVAPVGSAILSQPLDTSGASGGPAIVFAGAFASGSTTQTGLFSLALKKGESSLPNPTLIPGTDGACAGGCDETSSIGTGDVDGDGLEDVVTLVANTVHVYYRNTLTAGTAAVATTGSSK